MLEFWPGHRLLLLEAAIWSLPGVIGGVKDWQHHRNDEIWPILITHCQRVLGMVYWL
jgi:hypothetical protein